MTHTSPAYGRIMISPKAIATIAAHTTLHSYGVVGMAVKNVFDGIAFALEHDPRYGVDIKSLDDAIQIDLYIIIEYGTRISQVAYSVARNVRYQVERAIVMPVKTVNVHVQELRISDTD
jgi:uncharacterized alkaline shock family protein YloU